MRWFLLRRASIVLITYAGFASFARADKLAGCQNTAADAKGRIAICTKLAEDLAGNRRASATAYNLRGLAYESDDQLEAAFEDFSTAVRLDDKYASAYVNRCANLLKRGNISAAVTACTTAIEITRGASIALELRAKAYVQAGDAGAAIRDYDSLIEMKPHHPGYYADRGAAHLGAGDVIKALADAVEASRSKNSLHAYSELLHTIIEQYSNDERIAPLLPADKVADYFHVKAHRLIESASFEAAIAEVAANESVRWANRAGFTGGPRAEAYLVKGRVALSRGDTEGALAAFREVQAARPSDGEPWLLRARLQQAENLGKRGDFTGQLQSAVLAYAELTEAQRKMIGSGLLIEQISYLYSAIGNLHGMLNLQKTDPRIVTECDREASHPTDPLRVAPPVPFEKMNASVAAAACSAALKRTASEPRLLHQRARAHRKMAREEPRRKRQHLEAFRADMSAALKANYPAAFAVLPGAIQDGEYSEPQSSGPGGRRVDRGVEAFNRYVLCCAVAVSNELISRSPENMDGAMRAAAALISWSAELGSLEAHLMLAERAATRTTATGEKSTRAQAFKHFLIAAALAKSSDSATRADILSKSKVIRRDLDPRDADAVERLAERWKRASLADAPSWLTAD